MRLGPILLNLLVCLLEIGEGRLEVNGEKIGHSEWTTTPPVRQERRECLDSEYRPSRKDYCCNRCNPGYYKQKDCTGHGTRTQCSPCRPGSYTGLANFLGKCKSCQSCLEVYHQVEIEPCRKNKNTVCGCASGMFQRRIVDTTFLCTQCTSCKIVLQKCGGYNDTICHCEHEQYYDVGSKKCLPCDSCSPGSDCAAHCRRTPDASIILILAIISFIAFVAIGLGVLMYCLYRKYRNKWGSHSQSETGFTSSSELVIPCTETLIPIQEGIPSKLLSCSTVGVKLPDCVLVAGQRQLPDNSQVNYVIADLIPASRWKEFVRRLGMSDSDIERMEMDNRHSFREAQYGMVRLWRQKRGDGGATTEVICKVLNDMELNGCAEKFQEALQ